MNRADKQCAGHCTRLLSNIEDLRSLPLSGMLMPFEGDNSGDSPNGPPVDLTPGNRMRAELPRISNARALTLHFRYDSRIAPNCGPWVRMPCVCTTRKPALATQAGPAHTREPAMGGGLLA